MTGDIKRSDTPSFTQQPSVAESTKAAASGSKTGELKKLSGKILDKITSKPAEEKKAVGPEVFTQILTSTSTKSNKYRELYQAILDQSDPEGKPLSFNEMKLLHAHIEEKFREIEHEETNEAWVQRGDLLDAIDLLSSLTKGELKPMSAKADTKERVVDQTAVPLIPYKRMKEGIGKATEVASDAFGVQKPLRAKLEPVIQLEHSKAAATVQKLTARDNRFEFFMSKIYRTLTAILGKYQNNRFERSAKSLASMSRGLGIGSSEYLSKKTGRKLEGYYRGPRFLFGRSVHEFTSKNDWFKRDLTPIARKEYLAAVEAKEAKLASKYGSLHTENGQSVSRVVIANSDSRVRHHILEPGQFGEGQELTGKVLSEDAVGEAQSKADNPAYYAKKYKFTTKNLLGRESGDDMRPGNPKSIIESKVVAKQQERNKLIEDLEGLSKPESREANQRQIAKLQSKIRALDSEIKELSSAPELFVAAQHELLGGLWRTFDKEGATQIVQRLAPADVHNYVAPLNGKPLNHKEACEVLKKRMETRLAALKGADSTDAKELQKEIAHFEELIGIFEVQEKELGRASQATIDIYGTNASVSTPAISNQSRILAQNDRKVMMFLHEDGSFSMHVFIGATGVNKVDVDQQTEKKMRRGDTQGDMQFGEDRIEAKNGFGKTTDTTTTDSHRKLRLGEWSGGFPINGSTVISYYLPGDFAVLPKLAAHKETMALGEGKERAEIEVKANMGDPLLIKTEILYAQVVERAVSLTPESTLTGVKNEIKNLSIESRAPGKKAMYFKHDQGVLKKLKVLLDKPEEELSFNEKEFLRKFERVIEKRIESLQRDANLAKAGGMTKEEFDAVFDQMFEMLETAQVQATPVKQKPTLEQILDDQEEEGEVVNDLLKTITEKFIG